MVILPCAKHTVDSNIIIRSRVPFFMWCCMWLFYGTLSMNSITLHLILKSLMPNIGSRVVLYQLSSSLVKNPVRTAFAANSLASLFVLNSIE